MRGDVPHLVRPSDLAARIDEIGESPGEAGILIVSPALRLVALSHGSVRVGQQTKWKAVLLCEGPVLVGGIEGDAEDFDPCFPEL
jgi:hypothetical protein